MNSSMPNHRKSIYVYVGLLAIVALVTVLLQFCGETPTGEDTGTSVVVTALGHFHERFNDLPADLCEIEQRFTIDSITYPPLLDHISPSTLHLVTYKRIDAHAYILNEKKYKYESDPFAKLFWTKLILYHVHNNELPKDLADLVHADIGRANHAQWPKETPQAMSIKYERINAHSFYYNKKRIRISPVPLYIYHDQFNDLPNSLEELEKPIARGMIQYGPWSWGVYSPSGSDLSYKRINEHSYILNGKKNELAPSPLKKLVWILLLDYYFKYHNLPIKPQQLQNEVVIEGVKYGPWPENAAASQIKYERFDADSFYLDDIKVLLDGNKILIGVP